MRYLKNISFTNCQFHHNGSNGLILDPDTVDSPDGDIQTIQFDNISLINCSFNNPGVNIWLETDALKTELSGSIVNFRMIGCSIQQEWPKPDPPAEIPSIIISTGGSGVILGCDFFCDKELPVIRFNPHIRFFNPSATTTWRIIGNHFKLPSTVNDPATDVSPSIEIFGDKPGSAGILNLNAKVAIIGNHFESVFNSPGKVVKFPFVRILNGDPSLHVIHSNIGEGEVFLENDTVFETKKFSWIDVSPGVPMTLGSATTKGRNVPAKGRGRPVGRLEVGPPYYQVISLGADLHPLLPGAPQPDQVDYQVEVTFQWDAGSWWITNKKKDQFTINWTNKEPKNALLDWTLHL